MRSSCLNCARKHLAEALILAIEERQGYKLHKWLAIGEMAQAEAELIQKYPDIANEIRAGRKEYEAGTDFDLPIMKWLEELTKKEEEHIISD